MKTKYPKVPPGLRNSRFIDIPLERCDEQYGKRSVRVRCLKCGTPVVLQFGDKTKEQASAMLGDIGLWMGECPGYHVELSLQGYWRVAEAIDLAYAPAEPLKPPFIVMGPDDMPISPTEFPTFDEAKDAVRAFVESYAHQGYYSTASRQHIPLDELPHHCLIKSVAA